LALLSSRCPQSTKPGSVGISELFENCRLPRIANCLTPAYRTGMADKLHETNSNANPDHTGVEVFAALQSLSEVAAEIRTGPLIAAVGELCMDLHGRGL